MFQIQKRRRHFAGTLLFALILFSLSMLYILLKESLNFRFFRSAPCVLNNFFNDDESTALVKADPQMLAPRKNPPRRYNMTECPAVYGAVSVLVVTLNREYTVAQKSLECYLRSTNYTLFYVHLENDTIVNELCPHKNVFFKKHCAVYAYLNNKTAAGSWMLVLDADTGVVNPDHCIEEWIDDRVDIIFYERFFIWEIAAGNYLVKNSKFAKEFLLKWANMEFKSLPPGDFRDTDNGILQILIMESVMPWAKPELNTCWRIYNRTQNTNQYFGYVNCVKFMLGAKRIWPQKLKILRRAHAFVRDAWLTIGAWSDHDFMIHGWKALSVKNLNNDPNWHGWGGYSQAAGKDINPFSQDFRIDECKPGNYSGWNWKPEKRVSVSHVKELLKTCECEMQQNFPQEARILPYLVEPDIRDCYPNCAQDDE